MIDTDKLMARYLWVQEQMKTYSLDEALHLVMPVLTRKKMLELLDQIPEMLDEISRSQEIETGRTNAIKTIIQEWIDHYPEDIFVPISVDDHKGNPKGLITRVSAQMGRHMGKCLLEQIDNLMEENDVPY